MAADLLKKGRTSVKGMWSEKKGSTYDAVVILDDTGGPGAYWTFPGGP